MTLRWDPRTFLKAEMTLLWERGKGLSNRIVSPSGAEGFAVFFLGGLLDLERNFASCDVTVTGQDLPAEHVSSLCQAVAGRRKYIGRGLFRGSDLYYCSVRFEEAQGGTGSIHARVVLEIDRDVRTSHCGILLGRRTQQHRM